MQGKPVKKQDILTIPNLLSMLRLAMIPLFVWLYTVRQDFALTAAVLVMSGVTDVVDGFIARRFGMVSDLGKMLDPVADKLTQAAMLLCLLDRFPLMLVPFLLMAVKESYAAVSGMMIIRRTGRVLGAAWHGKMTTVLLYALMLLHVLWAEIPAEVSAMLIGGCVMMLVMSFLLYAMRNRQVLAEHRKENG